MGSRSCETYGYLRRFEKHYSTGGAGTILQGVKRKFLKGPLLVGEIGGKEGTFVVVTKDSQCSP